MKKIADSKGDFMMSRSETKFPPKAYSCIFYHFESKVPLIRRIISVRYEILHEITFFFLLSSYDSNCFPFHPLCLVIQSHLLKNWYSPHLQFTNPLQWDIGKKKKKKRCFQSSLQAVADRSVCVGRDINLHWWLRTCPLGEGMCIKTKITVPNFKSF